MAVNIPEHIRSPTNDAVGTRIFFWGGGVPDGDPYAAHGKSTVIADGEKGTNLSQAEF